MSDEEDIPSPSEVIKGAAASHTLKGCPSGTPLGQGLPCGSSRQYRTCFRPISLLK